MRIIDVVHGPPADGVNTSGGPRPAPSGGNRLGAGIEEPSSAHWLPIAPRGGTKRVAEEEASQVILRGSFSAIKHAMFFVG
jgi:hypothetical protein